MCHSCGENHQDQQTLEGEAVDDVSDELYNVEHGEEELVAGLYGQLAELVLSLAAIHEQQSGGS